MTFFYMPQTRKVFKNLSCLKSSCLKFLGKNVLVRMKLNNLQKRNKQL